ncbi:MAG: hypothetical protein ACI9HK_002235 [Pirellulaceae bacterium]|jgi:hypothetical protein
MGDDNPYQAPSSTTAPPRQRTRWRVTAVTLLLIFGIIGLIGSPIPLLVAHNRPVEFGGGITFARIAGVSFNAIGASLWIASGVLCWRGRWVLTVSSLAIGFLALVLGNQLLADLDL